MKKIQILGTGCPKCQQLAANAKAAIDALQIECEIEKITDIATISQFGVMFTPALAVNGQVKSSGRVLSPEAIKPLIQN